MSAWGEPAAVLGAAADPHDILERNLAGLRAATVSPGAAPNRWVLNPSVRLAARTTYQVLLGASGNPIRDVAGNQLGNHIWRFTTGG